MFRNKKVHNAFVVFIMLILFIACTAMAQKRHPREFFNPVAQKGNYPPVFKKLETVISDLYRLPDSTRMSEFFDSNEKIMDFAKILVQLNYLTDAQEKAYFDAANQKYKENPETSDIRRTKVPYTSMMKNMMATYVYDKLPWEWQFHIKNKYLLIVKPTRIYRDDRTGVFPVYKCDIVDDIKGNYRGVSKNATFVGNYVNTKMAIGKTYLVLVYYEVDPNNKLLNRYLIRGLVTEHYAIFPVKDDTIEDESGALRLGKNSITITEYKDIVRDFLHTKAEVPENE